MPQPFCQQRLVSDPARTDDLYGAGAFGDITTVFLCKPTRLTPLPNYPLVVSFALDCGVTPGRVPARRGCQRLDLGR